MSLRLFLFHFYKPYFLSEFSRSNIDTSLWFYQWVKIFYFRKEDVGWSCRFNPDVDLLAFEFVHTQIDPV